MPANGAMHQLTKFALAGPPYALGNTRLHQLSGAKRPPSPSADVIQSSKSQCLSPTAASADTEPYQMDEGWDALDIFDTAAEAPGSVAEISPEVEMQQLAESISQCVQDVQELERKATMNASPWPMMGVAVNMRISDTARYVETQAAAMKNSVHDPVQLRRLHRRCTAAKDGALKAFMNAYDVPTMLATSRKISDAVNTGGQKPAHAAAAAAVESALSIFAYPDLFEVVRVSVAAAAANVSLIASEAIAQSPSDEDEILQCIDYALSEQTEGKMVLAFIEEVCQVNPANRPFGASPRIS